MEWEALEDRLHPGDWRVEAVDHEDGAVCVTVFSGLRARERAEEYAGWKTRGRTLYGHDRTIHRTTHVDVETDAEGRVAAVWFRCMALPFRQSAADQARAEDMRAMYAGAGVMRLTAVTVEDAEPVAGGGPELDGAPVKILDDGSVVEADT